MYVQPDYLCVKFRTVRKIKHPFVKMFQLLILWHRLLHVQRVVTPYPLRFSLRAFPCLIGIALQELPIFLQQTLNFMEWNVTVAVKSRQSGSLPIIFYYFTNDFY
jgi:hypothetical protein